MTPSSCNKKARSLHRNKIWLLSQPFKVSLTFLVWIHLWSTGRICSWVLFLLLHHVVWNGHMCKTNQIWNLLPNSPLLLTCGHCCKWCLIHPFLASLSPRWPKLIQLKEQVSSLVCKLLNKSAEKFGAFRVAVHDLQPPVVLGNKEVRNESTD